MCFRLDSVDAAVRQEAEESEDNRLPLSGTSDNNPIVPFEDLERRSELPLVRFVAETLFRLLFQLVLFHFPLEPRPLLL